MSFINAEKIRKVYKVKRKMNKKEIVAVDNISFSVEKGEIFGLLGPNGAGKTTTIQMLSTLLIPDTGKITIDGLDVIRDKTKIRARMGIIMGGERGLYWRLSGRDNLVYFAELNNLRPSMYKRRIDDLLKLVGLEESADQLVETYSKGMKQRLHFARGLLTDPEILFMDEPTIGLDPKVSSDLRKLIKQMSKDGKTIIYTSHYMHEADELCDRIGIIKLGKLMVVDTPDSLKQQLKKVNLVQLEMKRINDEELRHFAEKNAEIKIYDTKDNILSLEVPLHIEVLSTITSTFAPNNIANIKIQEFSMEDVYLKIIGE